MALLLYPSIRAGLEYWGLKRNIFNRIVKQAEGNRESEGMIVTDYKRMVSYMYQYENGVKKKNIGFARVEAKDGQCKITLHMQLIGQLDSIFPTYLIRRSLKDMELVYLGDAVLKNQVMDSRLVTDATNIMDSGHPLSEMGGLLLFLNDKIFFATEWDDKPIVAAEVLEALRPKVKQEPVLTLEEELLLPKYKLPRGYKTMERLQRPDSGMRSRGPMNSGLGRNVEAMNHNPEDSRVQSEEAVLGVNSRKKQTESQEENQGRQRSMTDQVRGEKGEASEPNGIKERETEERGTEDRFTEESVVGKGRAEGEQTKGEQAEGERTEEITIEKVEAEESLSEEDQAKARAAEEQSAAKNRVEGTTAQGQKKEMEEAEPQAAAKIFAKYPRIYPFEDNEILICAKIEPADLGLLPKELWALSSNSFLVHGYYCYHHLIFAKMKNRHGCRYILGVPGIYHNREKFMAKMFGFDSFKPIRRRELRQGDFGYWYITVGL